MRSFSILSVLLFIGACAAEHPAAPQVPAAPTSPRIATLECGQTYDKSCRVDADCAVARTQRCCGELPVVGVRASERDRVSAACACPHAMACRIGPLEAEDGKPAKDYGGMSDIAVACVSGACTTHIL